MNHEVSLGRPSLTAHHVRLAAKHTCGKMVDVERVSGSGPTDWSSFALRFEDVGSAQQVLQQADHIAAILGASSLDVSLKERGVLQVDLNPANNISDPAAHTFAEGRYLDAYPDQKAHLYAIPFPEYSEFGVTMKKEGTRGRKLLRESSLWHWPVSHFTGPARYMMLGRALESIAFLPETLRSRVNVTLMGFGIDRFNSASFEYIDTYLNLPERNLRSIEPQSRLQEIDLFSHISNQVSRQTAAGPHLMVINEPYTIRDKYQYTHDFSRIYGEVYSMLKARSAKHNVGMISISESPGEINGLLTHRTVYRNPGETVNGPKTGYARLLETHGSELLKDVDVVATDGRFDGLERIYRPHDTNLLLSLAGAYYSDPHMRITTTTL